MVRFNLKILTFQKLKAFWPSLGLMEIQPYDVPILLVHPCDLTHPKHKVVPMQAPKKEGF